MTSREEGDRHIITLTSEGRAQLEERSAGLGDLFADFADAPTCPDPPDGCLECMLRCVRSRSEATPYSSRPPRTAACWRRSLHLILAAEAKDLGQ